MSLHRRFSAHLANTHRGTASELILEFSKIEGVINPGMDEQAGIFVTVYEPELVNKDQLTQKLQELGYHTDNVTDHEF